MIINKLKTISIAIFCLVISLYSETQGMDNQTDCLEATTVNHTANIHASHQNEIDALSLDSTPSQFIKLEDTQTSWASYLISPLTSAMKVANEFLSIAVHKPKLAIIIGLTHVIPIVAAVNCECWCLTLYTDGYCRPPKFQSGCRSNATACNQVCSGCLLSCQPNPRVCP